jgi:Na+-driven multidrug efflux pump
MAAPLVVSFWMRAAFAFVDTAYAATIGDAAVGAIGLTAPLEFLMIAVWVGLSTGLTSNLSKAMGAREGDKIQQYLRATWALVLWASPGLAVVGGGIWFYAPHMGLAPELARAFQIYGTVLVAGSSVTAFWSIIPDSVVKAHQDTRSTMWAGIWSNVINVSLNTLFLFVFHWGVFGIALSTVLGRIGGLVYALNRAAAHEARRKAADRDHRPGQDRTPYRSILALAIPSSLTFALMATETGVVNFLLSKLPFATEAIASYSIYYRVVLFAMNPVIAVGVALLPYSALRFGQGDVAGVRRGLQEAGIASAVYGIVIVGPVMIPLAPTLAEWLAEAPLTAQYTGFALRLVPLAVLLGAPFLLCRPVFEGMHRGAPGLIMATIRYVGLTVPMAWAGVRVAERMGHPGLYGLLLGLIAVAAIASAAFSTWLLAVLGALPRGLGARTAGPVRAESSGTD